MNLPKFILLRLFSYFIFLEVNKYAIANMKEIVFVVLSQEGDYHDKLYNQFYNNIQQYTNNKDFTPIIYRSHLNFSHTGHWTILPLIPKLKKQHDENTDWFVFCEDRTYIDFQKLLKLFHNYNANESLWFGYALYDREPTITHHFRFHNTSDQLKYPNFASGFVMSKLLISSLSEEREINEKFSIDASYELALTIWNEGKGPKLIHEKSFCITQNKDCTTYPLKFKQCGEFTRQNIYFAVKTTKKFHENRVSVIKKTWGRFAYHIGYFSEAEDSSIPTIKLNVNNTIRGHCSKFFAIIDYISKMKLSKKIKWVIIADDDTILSVMQLQQFLTCYNASQYIAIGERFGYLVNQYTYGYNFITGGGGTVLSIELIKFIAKSQYCKCPYDDAPDDMFLGKCLTKNGINILHSQKFHQRSPTQYTVEYLANDKPISFHGDWKVELIDVYDKWFLRDDLIYNVTYLTKTNATSIKKKNKNEVKVEL